MARLHEISDSEDDLPDISTKLYPAIHDQRKPLSNHDANKGSKKEQEINSSTKESKIHLVDRAQATGLLPLTVDKASSEEQQARKQRSIRLAHTDSLLLPISAKPTQLKKHIPKLPTRSNINAPGRTSPRKASKPKVEYSIILSDLPEALQSNEHDGFYDGLSEFIVDDSASELDIRPPRLVVKDQKRSPKKNLKNPEYRGSNPKPIFSRPKQPPTVIDLTSPPKESRSVPDDGLLSIERSLRLGSLGLEDSFHEDAEANLRLYVKIFSHYIHFVSNKHLVPLQDQCHRPSAPKASVSSLRPKVLQNSDCNLLPNHREYLHPLTDPV